MKNEAVGCLIAAACLVWAGFIGLALWVVIGLGHFLWSH